MDKFELEVVAALRELEIPVHMKGYQFIKTAMNLLREDPSAIYAVIKLYGAVAEKENTTASRVERGIRHAILSSRADQPTRWEVLGTDILLKNGEFLATLAEVTRIKIANEQALVEADRRGPL